MAAPVAAAAIRQPKLGRTRGSLREGQTHTPLYDAFVVRVVASTAATLPAVAGRRNNRVDSDTAEGPVDGKHKRTLSADADGGGNPENLRGEAPN